jgi:hypothetical protein
MVAPSLEGTIRQHIHSGPIPGSQCNRQTKKRTAPPFFAMRACVCALHPTAPCDKNKNLQFPESTKGWQPESCQPARESRII